MKYWGNIADRAENEEFDAPDVWLEIRQELAELNDEILKIKEQLNQE